MSNSKKTILKVIQGGAQKRSSWLNPTESVIGRSPFNRERIQTYRVSQKDLPKALAAGERQIILDMWWQVYGQLPPVPSVSRYDDELKDHETIGLRSAYACFRGIMRPNGEDDHGWDNIAFITKPKRMFEYIPSLSCVVKPSDVPSDLVHITYARLDFPEGRGYQTHSGKLPLSNGVITHWNFVEADKTDNLLPVDFANRFRTRLW